jgi:YL1 nuclear protein C-terminal domain
MQAPYTDPITGLRFHDKSVYELIKGLVSVCLDSCYCVLTEQCIASLLVLPRTTFPPEVLTRL